MGGHPPDPDDVAVPALVAVNITVPPLQSLKVKVASPSAVAEHGLGALIIRVARLFFENLLCNSISE
ncbi:MAG: hypothetical protein E6Q95_01110 [Chitinophagaceae bacterium]|nr:MAG: hypothetical protein E6Q95_01110 [Chitinophagaceae bacterium]